MSSCGGAEEGEGRGEGEEVEGDEIEVRGGGVESRFGRETHGYEAGI